MVICKKDEAYYDDNYINYELQTSLRKIEFYVNLLRKWIPPSQTIFELGIGKGHFLHAAMAYYKCAGCDINEFGVGAAKDKLPNADIVVGSYESIPTNPSPDAVVAWDVLEHIAALDEALSCIHSKIDKGGFLVGIVPVYDGPLGGLVRFLDSDQTHVSKLSRHQWLEKLRSHNFTIMESGGVIRKLIFNRYYFHIARPQFLMRHIGSAYYFVAQK